MDDGGLARHVGDNDEARDWVVAARDATRRWRSAHPTTTSPDLRVYCLLVEDWRENSWPIYGSPAGVESSL